MAELNADYVVPDGEPCIDKACAATSAEGCCYPFWMMCGHPIERPARRAALATAEREADHD